MSFREDYMAGKVPFDEIFDLTDEWSQSDDPRTLREYLGLNGEEEDVWITQSDEALEELMEQEKNRWIFFTDLDGTLLNDEKKISENTHKLLEEILSQGHCVVISTGRALPSAIRQARRLDLMHPGCYIICYNGGQVYDIEHKEVLYSASIPKKLVLSCFREAHSFGIHLQTYTDTGVLTDFDDSLTQEYCSIQGIPYEVTDNLKKALKKAPAKMLAIDHDHDKVEAFRSCLAPKVEGTLDLFLSDPKYLELVPVGVNKGKAVHFLADRLGVSMQHTVAAGDAENDLTMIKAAGIGCAMCNGEEAVRLCADYVTTADNNHDGAAEIIRKFIPLVKPQTGKG